MSNNWKFWFVLGFVFIWAAIGSALVLESTILFVSLMSAGAFMLTESFCKCVRPKPMQVTIISTENIVDGRTETEWYELIRAMGKDDFEELSRGPLMITSNKADDLTYSKDHAWDARRLMGDKHFDKLQREWYPEKYKNALPASISNGDMLIMEDGVVTKVVQKTIRGPRRCEICDDIVPRGSDCCEDYFQYNKKMPNKPHSWTDYDPEHDVKFTLTRYPNKPNSISIQAHKKGMSAKRVYVHDHAALISRAKTDLTDMLENPYHPYNVILPPHYSP